MKIPPARSDIFVTNPDTFYHAFLLYGPDAGLVTLRARTLHHHFIDKPKDPFRNATLEYKHIKNNPELLGEELYARSLIGGKRCVTILEAETTLPKGLITLLQTYNGNNVSIWLAGELSITSSLRKTFENEKRLATIACYKDDSASLRPIVTQHLKAQNMTISADALDALSYHSPGDRMMVMQELEKLVLYKGQNTHIDLADVESCIQPHAELSLDALCHAVASGSHLSIDHALSQTLEEGIPPISIIRTLIYYFMRLHRVCTRIENGESEQTAISSLKPPLFFKHVSLFKKHLGLWNEEKLRHFLATLVELEQRCKYPSTPPELLLSQFLILTPLKYKIST